MDELNYSEAELGRMIDEVMIPIQGLTELKAQAYIDAQASQKEYLENRGITRAVIGYGAICMAATVAVENFVTPTLTVPLLAASAMATGWGIFQNVKNYIDHPRGRRLTD